MSIPMTSTFNLVVDPSAAAPIAAKAAPALQRSLYLAGLAESERRILRGTVDALLELLPGTAAPFTILVELEGDEESPEDLARVYTAVAQKASAAGDDAAAAVLVAAAAGARALLAA
jgi:hypothetical protein